MSKLINKKSGVDGLQIIFKQYTETGTGTILTYYEFYDQYNNPIINPNLDQNIWNELIHNITPEEKLHYNFLSFRDLPENVVQYKQVIVLNPQEFDVVIKVENPRLVLVLDQSKLSGFPHLISGHNVFKEIQQLR